MMAAGRVLTAGRSESNDISIEHPTVSRRHIELRVNDDGSFDVIDLGASAGTFVFHNGEWTRFEHATVADDERLRLGSYDTTAGALFGMAREGDLGKSDTPESEDSGRPTEDVHEITTRRKARRLHSDQGDRAEPVDHTEEEDSTTRRGRAGGSKKGASKSEQKTVELPTRRLTSEAKRGPAARAARARPEPTAQGADPTPDKSTPAKIPAPADPAPKPVAAPAGAAPNSLLVAYLLLLFLGGFGAHRFYLRSIGTGVAQAALLIAGAVPVAVFVGALFEEVIATILALLGVGVLTGLLVWLVVDAFLIPGILRDRGGKPDAND